MNRTVKQIILVVVGTIIAAFGISLAIHAGFGGATLAILWDGVSKTCHITLGQASFLIALVMIIFCFFYDRKQVSWGTILYQVIYSTFVDIFGSILVYPASPVINFFLMVLGITIMAFGAGVYSYANFGRGPYEAMTFALAGRNNWQPKYARNGLDLSCAALGWILGGKPGVCTIVTIVLSGIVLQTTVEFLKKHRFIGLS